MTTVVKCHTLRIKRHHRSVSARDRRHLKLPLVALNGIPFREENHVKYNDNDVVLRRRALLIANTKISPVELMSTVYRRYSP